ncbi:ABC transporter substrate-binding protein [Paenibacillus darwinianus]|uniref:ABC transporter substrate-binding protein n=1 Tax=Paenibacillus darwinianus TaxID=1380763 RepID=A0A9W5S2S6_9BACL|nr:ABC transporter substrate-binding protein [Paenibacillus darwinianus]EXX87041.1 ABC transporter substrate-binding protein [Paenibacillus darwinianus]EXX90585.1 ABC transporter substrate-binding protein [Paenibacillus darwinianus]EXX90611.1 ABC transporter substrate-binding protein [Paenibacillus darwinianus]
MRERRGKSIGVKGWLALFAVIVLLTLSACGKSAQPGGSGNVEQSDGEQQQDFVVGYLNVMDDAQAMLAAEAKLYEKNGLNVTMQKFTSGTDLIKAMVGGQVDAGVLGFTNAVSWAAKGAGLKVVGGAQMGFHSILVKEGSGIEKVEDLKGKKLASQGQGSTADIVLNGVALKNANLTKQDVQMVYVDPAQAIQSLASGAVDAAFVFEPYSSMATRTMGVKQIYEIGKVWPFPCMVVITTDKKLKENRDAVNRLLDAQKEAIDMLQNDPDKSAELLASNFVENDTMTAVGGSEIQSVDVIKQAIETQSFNWEITPANVERMQEIADIMKEQGVLDKEVNVEDILDLEWQKSQ